MKSLRFLVLCVFVLSRSALQSFAHYHPDEGRWLSRDPIEEPGFLATHTEWHLPETVYNPYMFVDNAPIYKYDAKGLLTLDDYGNWFFNKKCWKCGPDVTEGLKGVKKDVEERFNALTKEQKFANCAPFALDTFDPNKYLWALIAWDIHGLAFEDVRVRGSDGVSLCPFGRGCKETVMVDGKCHWKWNVNYLLYGWMNKQCGVSKSRMTKVAKTYKFIKGDWGDAGMAAKFAGAGHDGWPNGGSIPEDKNYKDCGECSQKYNCNFWSSWPNKDPEFWKPVWEAFKDSYF